MSIEHYVVRKADGGPDLVWVAEVDFDAQLGVGEIRYSGGLEGYVEPLISRGALEQAVALWRDVDGCLVDLIP